MPNPDASHLHQVEQQHLSVIHPSQLHALLFRNGRAIPFLQRRAIQLHLPLRHRAHKLGERPGPSSCRTVSSLSSTRSRCTACRAEFSPTRPRQIRRSHQPQPRLLFLHHAEISLVIRAASTRASPVPSRSCSRPQQILRRVKLAGASSRPSRAVYIAVSRRNLPKAALPHAVAMLQRAFQHIRHDLHIRCGWFGNPAPPATRSSFKTRRVRNCTCSGSK